MRVFIDTEFTDFIDCHLISLGMVAESGEEFYAEVDYPESSCSPFVRQVVIPLLHMHIKCNRDNLKQQIINWLKLVRRSNEEIKICFDYQTDFDLLLDAINGELPSFAKGENISRGISELLIYDFWKKNPSLHEHHALYDARANAHAFRETKLNFGERVLKLFGDN